MTQELITECLDRLRHGRHVLLSLDDAQANDALHTEMAEALRLVPDMAVHALRHLNSESALALVNDLLADATVADATRPHSSTGTRHTVLVRADAGPAGLDALGLLTRLAKDMRALTLRWIVCGEGWHSLMGQVDWASAVSILPASDPPVLNPLASELGFTPPVSRLNPTHPGAPAESEDPDFLEDWEEDLKPDVTAPRTPKLGMKQLAIALTLLGGTALGWTAFQYWPEISQAAQTIVEKDAAPDERALSELVQAAETSPSTPTPQTAETQVGGGEAAPAELTEASPAGASAAPIGVSAPVEVAAADSAAAVATPVTDNAANVNLTATAVPPEGNAVTPASTVSISPSEAPVAAVDSPPTKPAPSPNPVSKAPQKNQKPARVGQMWARSLPAGTWLVQFASVPSDEKAQQWIQEHPQIAGVRRVSAVKADGSDHVVLVAGPYASRDRANAAAARVKPTETWVRTAASLQKVLPQ